MTARSGRGRFRLTDSRRFRVSSGAKIQNRYKRPTNGPETSRATCRKSETVGDGFKFRLSAEHPGTDKRNRSIIGITRPTGAFLKTVNFHRTFETRASPSIRQLKKKRFSPPTRYENTVRSERSWVTTSKSTILRDFTNCVDVKKNTQKFNNKRKSRKITRHDRIKSPGFEKTLHTISSIFFLFLNNSVIRPRNIIYCRVLRRNSYDVLYVFFLCK